MPEALPPPTTTVPSAVHGHGIAGSSPGEKAEAHHAAGLGPAERLCIGAGAGGTATADHDRAVGIHAPGIAGSSPGEKAEAHHAAGLGPAERASIATADHDGAVGVHALGLAKLPAVWPRRGADCRHAAGLGPVERHVNAQKAADSVKTDHDRAVGIHALGLAASPE